MSSGLHWISVENQWALELEGKSPEPWIPVELRESLATQSGRAQNEKALERLELAHTAQVKERYYQHALELHSELVDRVDGWERRRAVRLELAKKFRRVYARMARLKSHEYALQYLRLAEKLEDARPVGVWGVDPMADGDDELAVQWTNRAGLVKYCPDDGREEQQRIANLYVDRLEREDLRGHIIRAAVFTLPNVPHGHLGAAMDTIFHRLVNEILLVREDGTRAEHWHDPRRRHRDIIGAWACLEAPLSGRYERDPSGAWNVHLNVLLVFRRADELERAREVNGRTVPDYQPLVDAWGAMVHFAELPQGDVDAMRRAVYELIKYPVKAISEKSAEERKQKIDSRTGELMPPAPPMVEWPDEYVDEWHQAHKGFRRTRSWGRLYYPACRGTEERPCDRLERGLNCSCFDKRVRRNLDLIDWIGSLRWRADHSGRLDVSLPVPDSFDSDRARYVAERERARSEANARLHLTLIQGNKCAGQIRAGPGPTAADVELYRLGFDVANAGARRLLELRTKKRVNRLFADTVEGAPYDELLLELAEHVAVRDALEHEAARPDSLALRNQRAIFGSPNVHALTSIDGPSFTAREIATPVTAASEPASVAS